MEPSVCSGLASVISRCKGKKDTRLLNGKPIVAQCNFALNVYPEKIVALQKEGVDLETFDRIFGVVKPDNSVLKFRLIVKLEGQNDTLTSVDLSLQLIYMNEEPIDCKVIIADYINGEKWAPRTSQSVETDMSISTLLKKFT